MKKSFTLLILILHSALFLKAQRYQFDRYEAILGLGTTAIFGDIGNMGIRPAASLGVRYTLKKSVSFKASLDFGFGYGNDEGSQNEARGYSYSTFLIEPSIHGEFFFFRSDGTGYTRKGFRLEVPRFSSYAFIGLGAAWFKPTPGDEFEQDFEDNFRNVALVFPGGIGIQVGVARKLMIGIEVGGRYARTDYIDGYTSDNSKSLDVYYFAVLNAAYRFSSFSFGRGFE